MGQGEVKDLVLVAGDIESVEQRFNIVVVAEGYRADQQAMFEADVNAVMKRLAGAVPFKDYLEAFNIFRLHVWSQESGADRGGATPADTYFDAWFPGTFAGSASPPQLLLVNEVRVMTTVKQTLAAALGQPPAEPARGPVHKIIVLVNTDYDGGSGGGGNGIAVASRVLEIRTVLHELGHTFGLVDEYPPGGRLGPNLSDTLSPLPWESLVTASTPLPTVAGLGPLPITLETVGAFEDPAFSPVRYRPQWLCQMRYSCHDTFCKVCANHIRSQLATFAP